MATIPLGEIGILKPVRNPLANRAWFWRPLLPREKEGKFRKGIFGEPLKDKREELTIYPFQAILNKVAFDLNRADLEALLGVPISDYKIGFETRIYPPGLCVTRCHLYLRPKHGLSADGLIELARNLNAFGVTVGKHQHRGVFNAMAHVTNMVTARLLRRRIEPCQAGGYYAIFNLQGNPFDLQQYGPALACLLDPPRCPQVMAPDEYSRSIARASLKGRYRDDIVLITKRIAVLYLDNGIRELYRDSLRPGVLEGRRCFRHHFSSALELAYVVEALIKDYDRRFKDILDDYRSQRAVSSLETWFQRLITGSIVDSCARNTVENSILGAGQCLSHARGDKFWGKVYEKAYTELAVRSSVTQLNGRLDSVNQAATRYCDERGKQWSALGRNLIELAKVLSDFVGKTAAL